MVDAADFERIKNDGAKNTLRESMGRCMQKENADSAECERKAKEETEDALGVENLDDDKFEELKEDAARDEVG